MTRETLAEDALYARCRELFRRYPLAVERVTIDGTQWRMPLILQDGHGGFTSYSLYWVQSGIPCAFFALSPWRADDETAVFIEAGGGLRVDGEWNSGAAAEVILGATPVPGGGSMFGWHDGAGVITALIVFWTDVERDEELTWLMMPRIGAPADQQPPLLTGDRLGGWFWDNCQAGRIIPLDRFVAGTQRMIFWSAASLPADSGCILVAHDLDLPEGVTLPAGRYLDYRVDGGAILSLEEMLAGPSSPALTDLGPRFRKTSPQPSLQF